jgi:integrase
MLADAAHDKLIPANPIQARRRGRRRRTQRTPRKIWAEPSGVLHIVDQIAQKYGAGGAVLVVTAAWTGARWGELVGLQRHNLHLYDDNTGNIVIDPDFGALHEPNKGAPFLGQPKTEESARTITLPPLLVPLLRAHLTTHTPSTCSSHRRKSCTGAVTSPAERSAPPPTATPTSPTPASDSTRSNPG